jgi:hypothetical protein
MPRLSRRIGVPLCGNPRRCRFSALHRAVAPDRAGTIGEVGIDPTLEGRALQNALIGAIAESRGYVRWTVDHAGWVVTLMISEEQTYYGRTLSDGLAWCLVWLMFSELGGCFSSEPTVDDHAASRRGVAFPRSGSALVGIVYPRYRPRRIRAG